MQKHSESHMDHGFTQQQWDFIFKKYADKTAFFIDTFELPEDLGTVTMDLYGPSAGDPPVPASDVFYTKRGDRAWPSRMVHRPKRLTRFVRVIAGPHSSNKCPKCSVEVDAEVHKYHGYDNMVLCTPCDHVFKTEHACVLYTAYGVASVDMPAAPKEPGDLSAALDVHNVKIAQGSLCDIPALQAHGKKIDDLLEQLSASLTFWNQHALAGVSS